MLQVYLIIHTDHELCYVQSGINHIHVHNNYTGVETYLLSLLISWNMNNYYLSLI